MYKRPPNVQRPPPPASSTLTKAAEAATEEWRDDLYKLFTNAKERFADVFWELGDDEDTADEVWGHKAIVYARAPPSFQARYFKFRPAPPGTPNPYGASPIPGAQSTYSLSLPLEDLPPNSRSPSPYAARRAMSPAPSSTTGQILRLQTNISPALFANELEYLYTGKGFSDAFEFLFDSADERPNDDGDARINKLRNDLIYMWRSSLYSDVRVVLSGNFPSGRDAAELATAAFSSHRFMLVSRSQYFRDRLQSSSFAQPLDENEIKLPSPPFTPASVHFTLGFIYTGTLSFSHRAFDLTTAFHIYRSAAYLQLESLSREIEARLGEDMMHGLFHAFIPFDQYEKITAGRWGVGGCKCKQCQRRAPRILEFAMSPDVNNLILTRGAQRALSGMFGEGWCSAEFAALPVKTRSNLVKGVSLRTNAMNVIPLLFAAQAALTKLENNQELWAEEVREMVHTVRKRIDDTMCGSCEEVFEQEEWVSILERDGAQFGDNEKVVWVMDSLRRGLSDKTAGLVYQTLVSAVLIRPDATADSALLPTTSVVRAAVERARMDVVQWIGKKNRWQFVHSAGGFEEMDSWAVKEISDEIDVPVDTLLAARLEGGPNKGGKLSSSGAQKMYGDAETASISSFHTKGRTDQRKEPTPSMHSISKASMHSISSWTPIAPELSGPSSSPPTPSAAPRNQPAARLKPILSPRVQSAVPQNTSAPGPLSPPTFIATIEPAERSGNSVPPADTQSIPPDISESSTASLPITSPSEPLGPGSRPESSTASFVSIRSVGSVMWRARGMPATFDPRPMSAISSSTNATDSYQTAKSEFMASPATSPRSSQIRSQSQARELFARASSGPTIMSIVEVHHPEASVESAASIVARRRGTILKPSGVDDDVLSATTGIEKPVDPINPPSNLNGNARDVDATHLAGYEADLASRPTSAHSTVQAGSDGESGVKIEPTSGGNQHKLSDTLKPTEALAAKNHVGGTRREASVGQFRTRGLTLGIAIPCIISSKRTRFRAFVRYIGEVDGEGGMWVGVEVPLGKEWSGEKLAGRDWNDGSLTGIRYFEISDQHAAGGGDEEQRADRGRKLDRLRSAKIDVIYEGYEGRTRSVDQDRQKPTRSISPTVSDTSTSTDVRGLFVRPGQVVHVFDATSGSPAETHTRPISATSSRSNSADSYQTARSDWTAPRAKSPRVSFIRFPSPAREFQPTTVIDDPSPSLSPNQPEPTTGALQISRSRTPSGDLPSISGDPMVPRLRQRSISAPSSTKGLPTPHASSFSARTSASTKNVTEPLTTSHDAGLRPMSELMSRRAGEVAVNSRLKLGGERRRPSPSTSPPSHEVEIFSSGNDVPSGPTAQQSESTPVDPPPPPPSDEATRTSTLEGLLASLSAYSIQLSDLEIDSSSFLGRGGYGIVRLGQLKSLNTSSEAQTVAVKRLTHDEITISRLAPRLAREMVIWSKLKHRNILDFIGFHFSNDTGLALLVCPYLPLGNVNDYVRLHGPADKVRLNLIADAGTGLEYLHDLDVYHGDIKAANVLVDETPSGPTAVLCDFGLAKAMNSNPSGLTTSQGFKGSVRWCAPEIIVLDQPRTKASDIWSFGCLFSEVMKGKIPYHDARNEAAVIHYIFQNTPPASKADLPYGLRGIAEQCWKTEATERPPLKECMIGLRAVVASLEALEQRGS